MTTPPSSDRGAPKANDPSSRIAERLTLLWQRQRPELASRVDLLEQAAAAAADASLTHEMRAQAAGLAHKLAGALGLYGHAEAGKAAHKIELLLESTGPLNGAELQRYTATLRRVVAPEPNL